MSDKLFDQLMKGIDYGGVQVKSFDFGGGTGWSAIYYTSHMTRMTQLMKMKYLELITVQKYLHLKTH